MELTRKVVKVRGQDVEIGVPGNDASPQEMIATTIESLMLCLLALEDPRVDAILLAYDYPVEKPTELFSPPEVE